jgi:uncharacterized membrane protein YqhA
VRFVNIVGATRYLVLIPILGLAIAAAAMFAFGGLGLIVFVIRSIGESSSGHGAVILPIFGLLEFVHQFLIGTVLYITAMGLFQLFIQDVPLPQWMKTESAEDLETNLVGVTVVVLAIEFLGAVFSGRQENLLTYGAGVALPIAALALFLGAKHLSHRHPPAASVPVAAQHDVHAQPAQAGASRKEGTAIGELESNKV